MPSTIITKNSSTASSVPSAGSLTQGELAVNVADKRLYTKDSGGTVVELGTNPASLTMPNGTANTVPYLNGSKVVTSGTALSFDGSNLGLGVTPSAWVNFKALESTAGNSVYFGSTQASLGSNIYNDGAGWRYKTTAPAGVFNNVQGTYYWFQAPSGTAGNSVGLTQAMTLDASGNLGVGVTSPATRLEVIGLSEGEYFRAGGGTISARSLQFSSFTVSGLSGVGHQINVPNANGVLTFATGSTERARIDSSGNLLVGTTNVDPIANASNGMSYFNANATLRIRTPATAIALGTPTSSQLQQFYYWNGSSNTLIGSISNTTTSTAYNTSSDYRLKNSIAPMTGALAKVALLKPVTYKWNADGSDGEGFIAHELAEVCPNAVTGEKDAVDAEGNPQYQGIDVSFLVATLTAAIQELKAEFDAYKATHP